jgi:hypothetical protein
MPKYSLEDIGTWIQDATGMTDEQAQTAKTIAGFIPFVGTGLDIYDAINNPTRENIGWAVLGGLTDLIGGRIVTKAAKAAKAANKANKAVRAMSDVEKATKLRHAQEAGVRLAEERAMSQQGRAATNAEKYWGGIDSRRALEREYKNATKKTVTRGRAYTRTKIVDRHTSKIDPYIIKSLGWLATDFYQNGLQTLINYERQKHSLGGDY